MSHPVPALEINLRIGPSLETWKFKRSFSHILLLVWHPSTCVYVYSTNIHEEEDPWSLVQQSAIITIYRIIVFYELHHNQLP